MLAATAPQPHRNRTASLPFPGFSRLSREVRETESPGTLGVALAPGHRTAISKVSSS